VLYKDEKKENSNIQNNQLKINMIKEFNMGIIEYDTINPILSNNRDIHYIDKLIFNPLIDLSLDFKITNLLAKEFSKINSTTYLIKLKEDIFWHDGTKFTSKDVVFTIENLIGSNIKTIYKENVKNIKDIIQIDDYTVKIVLKEGTPFFEYMMCFPILASHSYDKNFNSLTTLPIGTGKYKILKIEDSKIEIGKFNLEDEGKINKINIFIKKNMKELYSEFFNKEIDFIITDNIMYEEYIGKMGYNIKSSKGRELEKLVFNTENKLLSNKNIRKAISYAINKQLINYKLYNNKFSNCDFPLDYGSYLDNIQLNIYEYDLNQAKNLLIKEGWKYSNGKWTKGNIKLQFDLIVNESNEKRVECANQIKEQLNNFGIFINVIKLKDDMYNSYIKSKNYDIILIGNIISNNPNIETYFGENNMSNLKNEELENILKEVRNINNEELLKQKYNRIKEIYLEEIPFMCLYFDNINIITNLNLKGDFSHNWYNLFYNIDDWYKVGVK
jgi:peptide/nickel transport system substrate-binding protein